jgi:hypothetical protein
LLFDGPGIALSSAAASIIITSNGTDDLGQGSAFVPENDVVIVKCRGEDGGADVEIQGMTTPQSGNQCDRDDTSSFQGPLPIPSERSSLIYDSLLEGLSQVPEIMPEEGNPGNLTDREILEIRRTLNESLLGIGRLAAAAEIERAREEIHKSVL